MQDYLLEREIKTPLIDAKASGEMRMEGICIPEDVTRLFAPFFTWLEQYTESPAEKTVMNVKLDYYNTSTASILLKVFRQLAKVKSAGKSVVINWIYEEDDEENMESGYGYAASLDIEFNVILFNEEHS